MKKSIDRKAAGRASELCAVGAILISFYDSVLMPGGPSDGGTHSFPGYTGH